MFHIKCKYSRTFRALALTHTSIASPWLCLLLLSSRHAERWHSRLPERIRCLSNWLGTKARNCRRLPIGLLGLHASKCWLR